MFAKRVRNRKLESFISYPIHPLKSLNQHLLLDYQYSNIKTGIEQDEEKETDLTQVLQGGKKEIFTPQILKDEKYKVKESTWKRPEKYIQSQKDCKNRLILSDKERTILKNNQISEPLFYHVLNKINEKGPDAYQPSLDQDLDLKSDMDNIQSDTNQVDSNTDPTIESNSNTTNINLINSDSNPDLHKIKLFILQNFKNRLLHINKTCFRKLTAHLSRKSRRSETACLDKLKKLYQELNVINKLFVMKKEEQKLNDEILTIDDEILSIFKTLVTEKVNIKDSLSVKDTAERDLPSNIVNKKDLIDNTDNFSSNIVNKKDGLERSLQSLYKILFTSQPSKPLSFHKSYSFQELKSNLKRQEELKRILRDKRVIKGAEIDAVRIVEMLMRNQY